MPRRATSSRQFPRRHGRPGKSAEAHSRYASGAYRSGGRERCRRAAQGWRTHGGDSRRRCAPFRHQQGKDSGERGNHQSPSRSKSLIENYRVALWYPQGTVTRGGRHALGQGHPREVCSKDGASDLTNAEWEAVAPLLPAPAATGRPLESDLREILNAYLPVTPQPNAYHACPSARPSRRLHVRSGRATLGLPAVRPVRRAPSGRQPAKNGVTRLK